LTIYILILKKGANRLKLALSVMGEARAFFEKRTDAKAFPTSKNGNLVKQQ